jgi:hypothetical protein
VLPVVERVQPHEIDHGQHDAVRDVFVAPGGCTLIRADLFDELGGFDPAIVAMGEDLDLCWRAQVVGARVLVAPEARVRHLEELASGAESLDPSMVAAAGAADAAAQAGADAGAEAFGTDVSGVPDAEAGGTTPGGSPGTATGSTEAPVEAGAKSARHPITLQELQRRHELLAVMKCYSRSHLLRVLPQIFLLAVGPGPSCGPGAGTSAGWR